MIIEKVSLVNVRKIKQFTETFSPTTTIITGKNGTGKTTITKELLKKNIITVFVTTNV